MLEHEPTLFSADLADDPFAGTAYGTIRQIGEGGMGVVLEVEHLALAKRLVAKVLKPHLVHDAGMADRFRFEAQVMAKLAHPNLVPVLDLGRTRDGRPFFVMEKLIGRTLSEELRARRRLPVIEAIDITVQVLAGLAAAHAHGLVHRDIKMENVFLCDPPNDPAAPAGEPARRAVKVLDFGVAKAARNGLSPVAPPIHPTAEGMVLGTPRYVAPEQIRGGAVDARADIYTTGIMLYTLLAGRSPFAELSGMALLHAHLSEPPPALSSFPGLLLPPSLEAAVLRALAKRPDERHTTAADFAAELLAIRHQLEEVGSATTAVVPRPSAPACPRSPAPLAEVAFAGAAPRALAVPEPLALSQEPARERISLRDVGVLLAIFSTTAVFFWALFVAGARLVGWW